MSTAEMSSEISVPELSEKLSEVVIETEEMSECGSNAEYDYNEILEYHQYFIEGEVGNFESLEFPEKYKKFEKKTDEFLDNMRTHLMLKFFNRYEDEFKKHQDTNVDEGYSSSDDDEEAVVPVLPPPVEYKGGRPSPIVRHCSNKGISRTKNPHWCDNCHTPLEDLSHEYCRDCFREYKKMKNDNYKKNYF